jgi:hypothetical protein
MCCACCSEYGIQVDNISNNFALIRKSWAPHAADYQFGDPTWAGGKGSEIIGAINYLASKGLNAFSFLTMNIEGDDDNVFMYTSDSAANRTRIDVSKCAQWEIVFTHADKMGMHLHFKTQETENDQLLDGGGKLVSARLCRFCFVWHSPESLP